MEAVMGRQRKRRYLIRETWQIMDMLRLLLDGHGLYALDYLTGRSPFPTTQELAEMLAAISAARSDDLGTHISPSRRFVFDAQTAVESTEKIQRIIARIGGAARIVEVFLWFRRECPDDFALLEDFYQVGRPGKPRTIMALATDKHMSRKTLYRAKETILEQVAGELARGERLAKKGFRDTLVTQNMTHS